MSELQAVFQARKQRHYVACEGGGEEDDDSDNAIVSLSTDAHQPPLQPQHQPSNIQASLQINNSNADSIEVSPSAMGRTALQLNNATPSPNRRRTPLSNTYGGSSNKGGNSNNRFGVRHSNPPSDLSPYEPSNEEVDEER